MGRAVKRSYCRSPSPRRRLSKVERNAVLRRNQHGIVIIPALASEQQLLQGTRVAPGTMGAKGRPAIVCTRFMRGLFVLLCFSLVAALLYLQYWIIFGGSNANAGHIDV